MRKPINCNLWDALCDARGRMLASCLVIGVIGGCGSGEEEAQPAADAAAPATSDAEPTSPDAMGATASAPADDSTNQSPAGEEPPAQTTQQSGAPGGMPGIASSVPSSSGGMAGGYPGAQGSGGYPGAQGSGGYPGASGSSGYPGMQGSGGYPGAMSGYPGASGSAVASTRPAAFKDWTDQHFLDAAKERDPKLVEAIDDRVASTPSDPKTAVLLTSLLAVDFNAASTSGAAAGGYPGSSAPPANNPAADPNYGGGRSNRGIGGVNPGAPAGGAAGAPGASGGAGAASGAGSPGNPQGRLIMPRKPSLAVDSISIMLAESFTAWVPQGAGVGAIAGGNVVGRNLGGQDGTSDVPAGGLSGGAGAAGAPAADGDGYAPPGVDSSAQAPPGASSGYPGGGPPGMGGYPGMSGGYPGSMGGSGGANGGLDANRFVAKVVDGLIKNGTPQAWQSVYGVAAGTLKTPVDAPKAAEIVVLELIRNRASNAATIDQILVALIDGSAKVPPESRAACLKSMAHVSGAAAAKVLGLAAADAAPAAGAGSGYPGMSGGALGGAPGMMSGGAPGMMSGYPGMQGSMPGMNHQGGAAPASPPVPPELLDPAAAILWGPRSVAAIASQLDSVTDPASAGDLLLLASTIPNQRVRESALGAFSKIHAGGAEPLNALGMFKTDVRDPGLLVVLKALPRTKPARGEGAEAQPLDSWSSASRDLVMTMRDQLRSASAKLTKTDDSFPVRFHKNGNPEVACMVSLPGTSSTALGESAPSETKVWYARMAFNPQRPRDQTEVLDHYESKASGYVRPDQAQGLIWIDGVKTTTGGARRSMDVIIQSANAGGGGSGFGSTPPGFGASGDDGAGLGAPGGGRPPGFGGGGSGSYTIEIVVVETADPKTGGSESTAQTSP